jgi:hypothetical protein
VCVCVCVYLVRAAPSGIHRLGSPGAWCRYGGRRRTPHKEDHRRSRRGRYTSRHLLDAGVFAPGRGRKLSKLEGCNCYRTAVHGKLSCFACQTEGKNPSIEGREVYAAHYPAMAELSPKQHSGTVGTTDSYTIAYQISVHPNMRIGVHCLRHCCLCCHPFFGIPNYKCCT